VRPSHGPAETASRGDTTAVLAISLAVSSLFGIGLGIAAPL